jgi:uncharacterized membrane protein (UPF0127 family)
MLVRIKIKRAVIRAEIADTVPKLALGLMFRHKLAWGAGMLLRFGRSADHAIHTWFVRFPLDVIFIKESGAIAHIRRAVPWELPFRAGSPVRYVLEVGAGFCRRHRIKAGDKVRLP